LVERIKHVSESECAKEAGWKWVGSRCKGREVGFPHVSSVTDRADTDRSRLQLHRSHAGGCRYGTAACFFMPLIFLFHLLISLLWKWHSQ